MFRVSTPRAQRAGAFLGWQTREHVTSEGGRQIPRGEEEADLEGAGGTPALPRGDPWWLQSAAVPTRLRVSLPSIPLPAFLDSRPC